MDVYIYQVFDMNGTFLNWWPFDTAHLHRALFEYTVLSHKVELPEGLTEREANNIQIEVYPNPTIAQNTLIIKSEHSQKIIVKLLSMDSKQIRMCYSGLIHEGTNSIYLNIEDISAGNYIYQIESEEGPYSIPFVKVTK